MSEFVFKGKTIYYETYGEGRPLLVLNGIMMSCASWSEFKEPFSRNNYLVLLDFLDQGRSGKMHGESYDQDIQVEVVAALMNELSLEKASILGISYGGEVALQFALKYPGKTERLMLFNTTAATSPWLRDIGEGWIRAGSDPEAYYLATIPVIYSPEFYRNNLEWMNKRKKLLCGTVFADREFIEAMERLTDSAAHYDVSERLREIDVPTLVVSSVQDYLTPVEEQERIVKGIKGSHHVMIPGCGHASMYEQPVLFASLALGFLNNAKMNYTIT